MMEWQCLTPGPQRAQRQSKKRSRPLRSLREAIRRSEIRHQRELDRARKVDGEEIAADPRPGRLVGDVVAVHPQRGVGVPDLEVVRNAGGKKRVAAHEALVVVVDRTVSDVVSAGGK